MTAILPPIHKCVDLPASRSEVFRWWTTREGLQSFFAQDARVELTGGGPFEILFDADEPPGRQGSEGCRVLAWVEGELLVVSWNAPPQFPEEREEIFKPGGTTPFVVVRLEDRGGGRTRVSVHHGGLPDRGRWPEVRAYFDRAWNAVLCWLEARATQGPLDWRAGPPRPTRDYGA